MKKVILIIIPVLIILGGGVFFLSRKSSAPELSATPTPTIESTPIQDLSEENPYGVDLTARFDKKAVFLKISSFPSGLKKLEYEITYDAKEGPRGVLGTIDYKNEDKLQREVLLGTCSKNVCRYDEGVKEVTLNIVFNGDKTEKFQGKFDIK